MHFIKPDYLLKEMIERASIDLCLFVLHLILSNPDYLLEQMVSNFQIVISGGKMERGRVPARAVSAVDVVLEHEYGEPF